MTVPPIALTAPQGPAGAPLLVLGCSLGTSAVLWETVVPLLGDGHRVAILDLPGHGRAAATTEPFTIGEIADALAQALAGSTRPTCGTRASRSAAPWGSNCSCGTPDS